MFDFTAEIRFQTKGKNELRSVKIFRTTVGGLLLPRKGERILKDGVVHEVTDVDWHYIGEDLTAVVVRAVDVDLLS